MNTEFKIFFTLFLFSILTKGQIDTSSLLNQYINSGCLIYGNVDKQRTDSLHNCYSCKQKTKEFLELKSVLNHRLDSVQNIADYHNTYIKDGYYYYASTFNEVFFDWKGCNSFFLLNGSNISIERFSHDDIRENFSSTVNCDISIKKEQFFNMRLDGLTGEHRFYKDDLR